MRKTPMKRAQKKAVMKKQQPARKPVADVVPETPEPVVPVSNPTNGNPLNNLKSNLSGKRKAIFDILGDVKKVKPEQWQDPNQVEQMAKNFAQKLGLNVPEQRIKAFMNAYKDATKNGQPNANVDELVKKYGQNVDDKTLKEIKKFVPKSK